ncbi:hypothetical protein IAT38_002632 [Cryptococcus sp. DSM 104549]
MVVIALTKDSYPMGSQTALGGTPEPGPSGTPSATPEHTKFGVDSGISFAQPHPPTPISPQKDRSGDREQSGVGRRDGEGGGSRGRSGAAGSGEGDHAAGPSHAHHHVASASTSPSSSAGPRAIPPPPNPRRHRSGILMSRVRAASGSGIKFGGGVGGSKSHGDLVSMGLGMEQIDLGEDPEEEVLDDEEEGKEGGLAAQNRWRTESRDGWKRVVSEGSRQGQEPDEEDAVWDNSARYYHHLHSRPPSRSGSLSTSPEQSPIASHTTSPIFVRRNLTLPPNGPGPPAPGMGSSSLSPNAHFLHSHLPPTFPIGNAGPMSSSPESLAVEHHTPATMVFTPTTQEWKDLQATPEWKVLHGEAGEPSFSGSSDEDEAGVRRRRGSKRDSHPSGIVHHRSGSDAAGPPRPPLRNAISAEYLGPENTHTPDPGSNASTPADAELHSPKAGGARPVFEPVVIAPSPVIPAEATARDDVGGISLDSPSPPTPVQAPEGPSRVDSVGALGFEAHPLVVDEDTVLGEGRGDSPARFTSFGRRDSLKVVRKDGEAPPLPRTKTKRELEREKFFSAVDEELEDHLADGGGKGWGGGVQSIGKGLGLGEKSGVHGSIPEVKVEDVKAVRVDPDVAQRASSADPLLGSGVGVGVSAGNGKEASNPFDNNFGKAKATSMPVGSKSSHLVHPFKPSPLNATPIVPPGNLSNETSEATTPADTPGEETLSPTPVSPPASALETIRDYARGLAVSTDRPPKPKDATPPRSPRSPRRRDTNRVSLVAGRVVQPFAIPPSTSLPPASARSATADSSPSLQSFSPFRSPQLSTTRPSSAAAQHPSFARLDSTISLAPSTGAPSECGTPTDEKSGGLGGRGIEDYVITSEAGKGAYGLVMRAKVKGPKGEPVGDEVIIKYIIKARILADCWKKHKILGPIPVEIHVMDQLRHLFYQKPNHMLPWDPARPRPGVTSQDTPASPQKKHSTDDRKIPGSPESGRSSALSDASSRLFSTQKYIAEEIKTSPERGHPNICKLLDFFEDREFYYLVMPRFGTGLDLFDRVESQPSGLEPFEVRSLVGQLADAVRFLHSNGIVHRDIKDENVILDGSGHCQLIDFGSAAHWRPGKRWDTFSGTLHYAAPEIMRGEMYGGKEQDIWALGVVAYVLLVGETPFSDLPDEVLAGLTEEGSANEALMARCGHGHEDEGEEADGGGRLEDAADLVRRCLELDVGDRASAEILLEHRYVKGRDGWVGKRGWIK